MSKRKVSFSLSGAESSKKGSEKKSRRGEEEISSKEAQSPKASIKEKDLLHGEKAIERYISDFASRDIELGKVMDFEWLEKENEVEIDVWLNVVGWKDFVSVNEPVYPKLLRILYANLNPMSMRSWIGKVEINLGIDAWCEAFNLPNLPLYAEAPIRNLSKEQIFQDLFGKDGLGVKNWVNSNELPTDPIIRLAAHILMNALIPKKGSKEQIKEEEGKILYTLKHGRDLNLAKEIVDRIKQSTVRKSTPLCYGMHLMILLKKAGVNLRSVGDKTPIQLKASSHINATTLGRLGFKKDFNQWIFVGRGRVKGRYTGESTSFTKIRPEEDSQRRTDEEVEGGATAAAEESTAPEQSSRPQPSSSTHYPSSPHIARQITLLQTTLTDQIAHLSSHLSEKLDYLTATISSRLENMDSKLDDLSLRVKSCETLLQPPPPRQSSHYTFTPQPPQPTQVPSPTQPAQASSSSTPTQSAHSPIPIPSSSSPSPQTKEPGSSPLFSIEELLQSASILQPESASHTTPSQPPQPPPPPVAPNLALQLVCSTLNIPRTPRTKKLASKPPSKTYHRKTKRPPQ